MEAQVTAREGSAIKLEVWVDLSGSMLMAEEAILSAVNEIGNVATKEALSRFDADGDWNFVAKRARFGIHAEIAASDRKRRHQPDPLGSFRKLDNFVATLELESNRLSDAVQGQVAGYLVTAVNGLDLTADEVSVAVAMTALAAGETTEPAFADWLRAHTRAAKTTGS